MDIVTRATLQCTSRYWIRPRSERSTTSATPTSTPMTWHALQALVSSWRRSHDYRATNMRAGAEHRPPQLSRFGPLAFYYGSRVGPCKAPTPRLIWSERHAGHVRAPHRSEPPATTGALREGPCLECNTGLRAAIVRPPSAWPFR